MGTHHTPQGPGDKVAARSHRALYMGTHHTPQGPGDKAAATSQGTTVPPPIPALKLTPLRCNETGKILQGSIRTWGCTCAPHSWNFRLGELRMQHRGLEGRIQGVHPWKDAERGMETMGRTVAECHTGGKHLCECWCFTCLQGGCRTPGRARRDRKPDFFSSDKSEKCFMA